MKKTVLLCSLLGLLTGYSYSQVGVNTTEPKGVFHIDGVGNNDSKNPLPTNKTIDDFVVDGNGNVGIGTDSPMAKVDIVAYGGKGLRMNDGTAEKGKIIVSDANGKLTWGDRPSPDQVEGSIILISTPLAATSTTAPNLSNTVPLPPKLVPAGYNPAVKISDKSLELAEGTWLVQLKYTTRTTNGSGGNFQFGGDKCGNPNGQGWDFYIWTLLYDETNNEILTTVGTTQERTGACASTPQLSHVVKVDAGTTKKISVYASTSTPNNVVVYKDGDSPGFVVGPPYFRAVRLDTFH